MATVRNTRMSVVSKEKGRVCTNRSDRHHDSRLAFPLSRSSPPRPAGHHESNTLRSVKPPTISGRNLLPQTMSQLPLADATPLRITGTLFKDLAFAFQQQDIPDGARTLRALRVSLLVSLTSIRL